MNGSAGPDHRARLERARAEAAAADLDGLWIGPGPNFRWLTGESAHPGGWPLWLSAVLVPTEGEPALIVSKMHAQIFDLERCPVASVFTYVDGDDPSGPLRDALAATGLAGSATVGGEDSLWFGDVDLVRLTVTGASAAACESGLRPPPRGEGRLGDRAAATCLARARCGLRDVPSRSSGPASRLPARALRSSRRWSRRAPKSSRSPARSTA